jgi:hypothetical protein
MRLFRPNFSRLVNSSRWLRLNSGKYKGEYNKEQKCVFGDNNIRPDCEILTPNSLALDLCSNSWELDNVHDRDETVAAFQNSYSIFLVGDPIQSQ